MVGRSLSPKLTMDDAVSYLTGVKETFHDEPAKCTEFLKVLNDIKAHRINKGSGIARMTKLIEGHPRLLRGLSVFLPKAKITIPPKDDKGLRQFQTLDYIELPPALYTANEHAYVASVKEAFHDEPAKYKEWKNIYLDYKARRIDETGVIARWEKVLKDHRSLLIRFSALLPPGAKITIPPKDNKGLGLRRPQTIGSTKVSLGLLKKDNAIVYLSSVKKAFHDEPAKYQEWLKTIQDFKASGLHCAGVIARLKKLMKDHRNLLQGLNSFLPRGAKITIPPEAKQHIAPDNNKRKRAKSYISDMFDVSDDSDDPDYVPEYMNKLKKQKREKKNVSPPKKKMKLNKRTMHCKKCGQAGHNSRSCGKRARQACGSSGSPMEASQPQRSTQQAKH